MRIRWLRSGSVSLRRHLEYIKVENPPAAARVGRHIRRSVLRLSEFPFSGRSGHLPGTRELVVPGLPYLVVYRARMGGDSVDILRVLHTASDWPRLMGEDHGRKSTPEELERNADQRPDDVDH